MHENGPLSPRSMGENWGRLALSSGIGGLAGVFISFIVNCTLAEISISPFFSLVRAKQYFGVLFIIVGCVMIWRLTQKPSQDSDRKRNYLLALGIWVTASGFLCFMLEKDWFVGLGWHMKIPMYSILGVAVCFALAFSLIDLINYTLSLCKDSSSPLISSPLQFYLLTSLSVLMGLLFGLIFGLMDIEDSSRYQIRLALMREETWCYPIGKAQAGFGMGGLGGLGNEWVRTGDWRKAPDEFEDEI